MVVRANGIGKHKQAASDNLAPGQNDRRNTLRNHDAIPDKYRRWRLPLLNLLLGVAALVLAACGGGEAEASMDASLRAVLDEFPAGTGRGYPAAQLLAGSTGSSDVQIGKPAPDFALLLEDGRHTTLSDLRGRPVVINFWATWCGPCRIEMPELMRAAAEDPNLVMLAVNVQESREQVSPFADEFAMAVPVVIDPAGAIKTFYAVRGLPTTYFIDKSGEIAAIYAGTLTPAALEERLAMIR
jgi:thiol-disulfide isomerase/thioredoxin